MISVSEALERVTALCSAMETETVTLADAAGRVLAEDVAANRDQPPFHASAMDGYAVSSDAPTKGTRFRVIGEAAAGRRYAGHVDAGKAVRIFTGAPVPEGALRVIIQEDTTTDSDVITLTRDCMGKSNIRPLGDDFKAGDRVRARRLLTPEFIALLAAMNIAQVPVFRKPVVAIIATGDELVMPGENPGPDQIIASNNFGLKALFEREGAEARMLPIARDSEESLRFVLGLAKGADMIVTIGGASVGDYDIVQPVAQELGMETNFYKVAMRPGKPLMAGTLDGKPLIGLPGNPVSSMVCAHVFLRPCLRRMLRIEPIVPLRERVALNTPVAANGAREHYMRARLSRENGAWTVGAFERQDSALLSVLSQADAYLIRPANDPAREPGDMVEVLRI
ncbi:MAG: gephyrin-like molybdotransferase Glp [Paracoccaceae bacterium]